MADINASLHITKRKRKSNVQHHSQADDLRARFKVPEWGVFCHTERLRDHPARLNLVLSDSAILTSNNFRVDYRFSVAIIRQMYNSSFMVIVPLNLQFECKHNEPNNE